METICIWIDEENKEIYFSNKEDIDLSEKYQKATYEEVKKFLNTKESSYSLALF